jgi:hypothetical protein
MLLNVQQSTIRPIITNTVAPDALVHTDEYDIYARLPDWGATATRQSAMLMASMRATKTVMASAKSTSTPLKASGHCYGPGYVLSF